MLGVLVEQLEAALSGSNPDPFEVASLAGLLDRVAGLDPQTRSACEAVGGAGIDFRSLVQEAVDRLADLEEGADPEEVDSVLFTLDEIASAAFFVGRADEVATEFDIAVATLRAFPEVVGGRGPLARELLRQSPPRDPSLAMWQAVAGS